MTITLSLFGGARLARADGEPCEGRAGQRRRLAVLAILAASRGEPVPRERIVSLLWPDVATALGRRSLAESLHVIHKDLGEDPVVRRGDELALDLERVRCDVVEFERALGEDRPEDAVALYTGPFIDGLVVRDAPDFSFWADRTRERLQHAFASAVERAAGAAEARGAWGHAVGAWRRLSEECPESTPAAMRLARALEGSGDRAAALRRLQFHETYLRGVLDLDVPEEVHAFIARLRAAPPAAGGPERAPVPMPAVVRHSDAPPDDGAESEEEPVGASSAPPEAAQPAPPAGPPAPGRARRSLRTLAVAGAAGAVLLAVAAWWGRSREEASGTADRPPLRVAVAGCVGGGEDPEMAGICGGLMDLLTVELGGVEALSVVRPFSGLGGGPRNVPLDSLAGRWDADAVLAGTLERSGGRVRHTLLLIDPRSGGRVHADTLEVPAGEKFSLQETLARRAARLFRSRLGTGVAVRALDGGSESPRARGLVMRAYAQQGRALQEVASPDPVRKRVGERRLARVDTLLMRAGEEDPRWMAPLLLRGWTAWHRAQSSSGDTQVALLSVARGHADRAVKRAPDDPEARELRAQVLWNLANVATHADSAEALLDSASRDAATAVDRDEGRVSAWNTLSQIQRFQGRHEEAYYAAVRGREMDHFLERDASGTSSLLRGALAFGRFDLAERHCLEGARDHPESWRFAECPLTILARTDTGAVDTASAAALMRRLDEVDPWETIREDGREYARPHRRMLFAAVLARAGARSRTMEEMALARSYVRADDERSFLYDEAHVHLFLGDTAQAKRVLDAYRTRYPLMRRFVAADYLFRTLRE